MTRARRIYYFISGVILLPLCVLVVIDPKLGYQYALLFLELALIFHGLKHLVYFFALARYKTGGVEVLFKGLLILDAGLFAFDLHDVPRWYGMIFLIGAMLVSGAIDIMQGAQAMKMQSGHWKSQLAYGVGKAGFGLVGFFFLNSMRLLTVLFALGLLNMAVSHIIIAFKKTDIVYIQ
ncbi:MAG: hypothetical protein K6E33_04995 [Lachnospiraceae bacterium]|nr:hypothetical protein [Lachnospiraceae bacterium]